ncbi:MAG TPA: hypothetical protein VJ729_07915 [Nitrososphaeraceae archaeon]|nr:hypothetical protein [Nitrososphaeraceae archaeon]
MSLIALMAIAVIIEELAGLLIRYVHFFSSITWWGIMFFMFVIIFPANKDRRYSTLFPRVQKFMKVIASVAMVSGIVLILVNRKLSIVSLFDSSWGYTILTGTTISLFVYIHILMQNRRYDNESTTRRDSAGSQSSSLLIPSALASIQRDRKNPAIFGKNTSHKRKTSTRLVPWLLFLLLSTTVVLMVYASHGFN